MRLGSDNEALRKFCEKFLNPYLSVRRSPADIKRCYKTGAEGSRMADVVQDIWLKEFEELGEDQVRERTAAGIWGGPGQGEASASMAGASINILG